MALLGILLAIVVLVLLFQLFSVLALALFVLLKLTIATAPLTVPCLLIPLVVGGLANARLRRQLMDLMARERAVDVRLEGSRIGWTIDELEYGALERANPAMPLSLLIGVAWIAAGAWWYSSNMGVLGDDWHWPWDPRSPIAPQALVTYASLIAAGLLVVGTSLFLRPEANRAWFSRFLNRAFSSAESDEATLRRVSEIESRAAVAAQSAGVRYPLRLRNEMQRLLAMHAPKIPNQPGLVGTYLAAAEKDFEADLADLKALTAPATSPDRS